jgi:hypothetical protein
MCLKEENDEEEKEYNTEATIPPNLGDVREPH